MVALIYPRKLHQSISVILLHMHFIFQNTRKIPSDPQELITPITNSYPKHPDSPFYGPSPIKPLATLTLTKIKEVCGGDEGSQSVDDVVPSTEDLVNQMKKKMMLTKKLGKFVNKFNKYM